MTSAFLTFFLAGVLPALAVRNSLDDALATSDESVSEHAVSSLVGQTLRNRYRLLSVLNDERNRLPPGWKPPPTAKPRPLNKFPWGNDAASPLSKEEFDEPGLIGKGNFGVTYKAFDKKLGSEVAVKIFFSLGGYIRKFDIEKLPKLKARVERNAKECTLVQDMVAEDGRYPEGKTHICKCLSTHTTDGVADDDVAFIVLELCGTSMQQKLEKQWSNPAPASEFLPQVRKWIKGTLQGVEFMSGLSPPRQHLDLKLDNAVVTDEGEAKLIDFGHTVTYDVPQEGLFCSLAPPEHDCRGGGTATYPVEKASAYDVWTTGAMYYNLLCSQTGMSKEFETLIDARKMLEEKGEVSHCGDGTFGAGKPEDWEVISHALTALDKRWNPDALIAKLEPLEGLTIA